MGSRVAPIEWLPDSWLTGPCSIVDCHVECWRAAEVARLEHLVWACWVNQTYPPAMYPPAMGLRKRWSFSLSIRLRGGRIGVASQVCAGWSSVSRRILRFSGLQLCFSCFVVAGLSYISCMWHFMLQGFKGPWLTFGNEKVSCNEQLECSLKIRTFNFLMSAH